jgi:hypothetical protein
MGVSRYNLCMKLLLLIAIACSLSFCTQKPAFSYDYQELTVSELEHREQQQKNSRAQMHLTLRILAYLGAAAGLLVGALAIKFMLTLLPKPVKRCSLEKFKKTQRIVLQFSEAVQTMLPPASPEFKTIIANLTDEKQDADPNVLFVPAELTINDIAYHLEISATGWNFQNEPRNCRRIRNNMALSNCINTLIEKAEKADS